MLAEVHLPLNCFGQQFPLHRCFQSSTWVRGHPASQGQSESCGRKPAAAHVAEPHSTFCSSCAPSPRRSCLVRGVTDALLEPLIQLKKKQFLQRDLQKGRHSYIWNNLPDFHAISRNYRRLLLWPLIGKRSHHRQNVTAKNCGPRRYRDLNGIV